MKRMPKGVGFFNPCNLTFSLGSVSFPNGTVQNVYQGRIPSLLEQNEKLKILDGEGRLSKDSVNLLVLERKDQQLQN